MLRQLQPWHQNVDKRQVKAPKVYLRDSGLLHDLLGGVNDEDDLLSHPKLRRIVGRLRDRGSPEGSRARTRPTSGRSTAGAELDLLLLKDGRKLGIEIKRADAPKLEPSMRAALEILELDRLLVLYPGSVRYSLSDRVTVVPMAALAASIRLLGR